MRLMIRRRVDAGERWHVSHWAEGTVDRHIATLSRLPILEWQNLQKRRH